MSRLCCLIKKMMNRMESAILEDWRALKEEMLSERRMIC